MRKISIALLLLTSILSAKLVDGVAVVVEGVPITIYEIKQEMFLTKADEKTTTDVLIRAALEKVEIKKRAIVATDSEVYEEIKNTARQNNLTVDKFYSAIMKTNGLNSQQLQKKIKTKILTQKLYSSIASKDIAQPTKEQVQIYYETNKEHFNHPTAYKTLIYGTTDQKKLQKKVSNPMLNIADIRTDEQMFFYAKINQPLRDLLKNTPLNTFSKIVPDGKGSYMSFFVKEIVSSSVVGFNRHTNEIRNILMGNQRENVLGDFFARLKQSADIKRLRKIQ